MSCSRFCDRDKNFSKCDKHQEIQIFLFIRIGLLKHICYIINSVSKPEKSINDKKNTVKKKNW